MSLALSKLPFCCIYLKYEADYAHSYNTCCLWPFVEKFLFRCTQNAFQFALSLDIAFTRAGLSLLLCSFVYFFLNSVFVQCKVPTLHIKWIFFGHSSNAESEILLQKVKNNYLWQYGIEFYKEKHSQRRCVVCTSHKMRKMSTIRCSTCQVTLCLEPCFKNYHSLQQY